MPLLMSRSSLAAADVDAGEGSMTWRTLDSVVTAGGSETSFFWPISFSAFLSIESGGTGDLVEYLDRQAKLNGDIIALGRLVWKANVEKAFEGHFGLLLWAIALAE